MPKTTEPAHKRKIRTFIEKELLFDEGPPLTDGTPLFSEGVLDSLSAVALLGFLEDRLGIKWPDDELPLERLTDLSSITAWVDELIGQGD